MHSTNNTVKYILFFKLSFYIYKIYFNYLKSLFIIIIILRNGWEGQWGKEVVIKSTKNQFFRKCDVILNRSFSAIKRYEKKN